MSDPRILIIDDNQYDRALALREIKKFFPQLRYREILEEAGLNMALAEQDFDLVVTDYQLLWIIGLDILYSPDCQQMSRTASDNKSTK